MPQSVITILLTLLLAGCSGVVTKVGEAEAEATGSSSVALLYGLPVDSFEVEQLTVARGQLLGQILMGAGVSNKRAIAAYDQAMPTFDFRQMRAGRTCCLFFEKGLGMRDEGLSSSVDSVEERVLRHFVYEITPAEYVRLTLPVAALDTVVVVERVKRAVDVRRRSFAVSLTTNMWDDMRQGGVAPQSVLDLSDIFAWSLDFFGLDVGSRIALICDEQWVGDARVAPGEIVAAACQVDGKMRYAFRHECQQDSLTAVGYYDLQGNSLRRTFLRAPLHYALRGGGDEGTQRVRHPHNVVEYRTVRGARVLSVGDGSVAAMGRQNGTSYIRVRHNSVYTSVYQHLANIRRGVKVGSAVRQGETLGPAARGAKGQSYVLFQMLRDGKPVPPERVDMPPAEPIDNDDILDFMEQSDRLKAQLDSLVQGIRD